MSRYEGSSDPECILCGEEDCPHGDPLHYHHDGCPACESRGVRAAAAVAAPITESQLDSHHLSADRAKRPGRGSGVERLLGP